MGGMPPSGSAGLESEGQGKGTTEKTAGRAFGSALQTVLDFVSCWCGRGDSNPHALASASPSSWCVCQFRHFREEGCGEAEAPRDGKAEASPYFFGAGAGACGAGAFAGALCVVPVRPAPDIRDEGPRS